MKKLFFAATAVVATAAIMFSVLTSNASSLQDLRAKANPAATYCAPNPGTDCKSHATGNIYPDYTAKPYPEASLD